MYTSKFEHERTFTPSGLVPILDESLNVETKTFYGGREIKAVINNAYHTTGPKTWRINSVSV